MQNKKYHSKCRHFVYLEACNSRVDKMMMQCSGPQLYFLVIILEISITTGKT
jgi:hypothetical protein